MKNAFKDIRDFSRLFLEELNKTDLRADSGYCYAVDLSKLLNEELLPNGPLDVSGTLFENGRELGPAATEHGLIRERGGGAYSVFGKTLWFSASDNSDPRENGRSYTLLVARPDDTFEECSRRSLLRNLLPYERYELAKAQLKAVWPDLVLPDRARHIDSDQHFLYLFRRVCPEAEYSLDRKYALKELFKLTRNIEGDVAECGVYKGASAFFLAKAIIDEKLNKRLCLFDSFEGLSEPQPADGDAWVRHDMKASEENLKKTLSILGDRTTFVDIFKGWIPDQFKEVAERSFSFVHIDVDLAQPTLDSLNFFYSRLRQGGVIVIDDYGFTTCPGVTKVVDEFFLYKREPIIRLTSGGCFVIKTSLVQWPSAS